MKPSVVLSYGLGVDSTAILLRWLKNPSSRDFDLDELLVVTAMTGDEWDLSGALVTNHILPLLREHRVRYVQLARRSLSTKDWVVLDDSRSPQRLFIEGAYRLSDEMFAAGTIPQRAGERICSMHAKGEPIDFFLIQEMDGRPFRHVIGFEANEPKRAERDKRYDTKGKLPGQRSGEYPLIEWGWTRSDCLDYIHAILGVAWPKSACTFCPFALSNRQSRKESLARFEQSRKDGAHALLLEHIALALNPQQTLCDAGPLPTLVSSDAVNEFLDDLAGREHAIYEVRRILRAKGGDKTKRGNVSRSVTTLAKGSRAQMLEAMRTIAERMGKEVEVDGEADQHSRVSLLPRPEVFPGVEQFLTVAPAVVQDKKKPNFEQWWLEASIAQRELSRS